MLLNLLLTRKTFHLQIPHAIIVKEQWGKEQSLQMQEQTLHQIKQKLESVLGNHGRDSSDRKLDDYLEHIEHFEAVRDSWTVRGEL